MFTSILLWLLSNGGYDLLKRLLSDDNPKLIDRLQKAYYQAEKIFHDKYGDTYGELNNDFLSSQNNFDTFLKSIDISDLPENNDNINKLENIENIPTEVINDFLEMLHSEFKKDEALNLLYNQKVIIQLLQTIHDKKFNHPKFVEVGDYFNQQERHLQEMGLCEITRFSEYLKTIENFINSQNNILIIDGKGGNGKTHLLREFKKIDSTCKHEIKFVIPELRNIDEAIQEELIKDSNYIIVFDDVERSLRELPELIALIKSNQNRMKLVLSTRPSGVASVDKFIYDYKVEDLTERLTISEWTTEEYVYVLEKLGVNLHKDELRLIARKYPNTFLINWIGNNYKGIDTITIEQIKIKFVGDLHREVVNSLEKILKAPIEFIIDLSLIVPFHYDDKQIKSTLSERYKITSDVVKEVIDLLIVRGILRRIGRSVRFDPDMKGDLLLFYYLEEKKDKELIIPIFEFWMNHYPETVFINIQAITRYIKSEHVINFCSDMVNKWLDDAGMESGYERIEKLKMLSFIAHLIPAEAMNLIHTYLDTKCNQDIKNNLFKSEPSTDDYGPVLISLMWISETRSIILKTILKIANLKIGIYDNYKPTRLIRNLVSPLFNNSPNIISTLVDLEKWGTEVDDLRLELVLSALQEVLSSTHEIFKSYGQVFKIWEEPIPFSEDAISARKKAIVILHKLLKSSNEKVVSECIGLCRNIGESRMGRVTLDRIPLKDVIISERKELVKILSEIISNSSMKNLQEIEDLFLHWYAAETTGTENVKEQLLIFPRDIEYLVFKLYVEPNFIIYDFHEVVKNEPPDNKWNWMFDNYFLRRKNDDKICNRFVNELATKYTNSEDICSYLNKLDTLITPHNPWNHPPLVGEWMKINKESYLEIRSNLELWNRIPERFKYDINMVLSRENKEQIVVLANELFEKESILNLSLLQTFLSALQISKYDIQDVTTWIRKILKINDSNAIMMISQNLWAIYRNYDETNQLAEICCDLLEPFEVKKLEIFRALAFSFELIWKNYTKINSTTVCNLQSISETYCKNIQNIDHSLQYALLFTYNNKVKALVDLLKIRFEKETKDYHNYLAVPHGGISHLNIMIDDIEKFRILLAGVLIINEEISCGGIRLGDLNHCLANLVNPITKRYFIVEHVEYLSNNSRIEEALELIPYFIEVMENIDLIYTITNKGIELNLKDNVINTYHKLFLKTSFGFGTEDLEKRKAFFSALKKKAGPGLHNKIINDQIRNVETELELFHIDDEEYYNERG